MVIFHSYVSLPEGIMFSNMGFLDSIQAAKEENHYPIYPRICLWAGKSEDPENQEKRSCDSHRKLSIPVLGTRLLEPYICCILLRGKL